MVIESVPMIVNDRCCLGSLASNMFVSRGPCSPRSFFTTLVPAPEITIEASVNVIDKERSTNPTTASKRAFDFSSSVVCLEDASAPFFNA